MPVKAYAVGCKKNKQIVSDIKTLKRLLPNGNVVTFIIGKTKKCGTASVIVENRKPKPCKKSGAKRSKSGSCVSK